MVDFRDYEFLADEPWKWWILNGFCVTFVRDISAQVFLASIGADVAATSVHGEEELGLARPLGTTDRHFVGVSDVLNGWAFAIETHAGYLGVSVDVMGRVASAHDVVSIYGAEGRYQFAMWVDGTLQVSINPKEVAFDSSRSGADPQSFLQIWEGVSPDAAQSTDNLEIARSLFAAAETITGVAVTEDILTNADYIVGSLPALAPPAADQFVRRLRDGGWSAGAVR